MKKFLVNFVFLFSLSVHGAVTIAQEVGRQTYTFGVVPQQSASKLAKLWVPMFVYISKQSNVNIEFKTAPNIPVFEQRLLKGEYDFAYMNPYHFTVFNHDPGYYAIVKAKDKKIKGIIVVQKSNSISDIRELNGKPLAFPAPASFAATLLPTAHFKQSGIEITPHYVSSHDSVYRSVAKGLFPAGGGVVQTFNTVDPEIRKNLRILWTTNGYTPHAIAVHPRVSSDVVEVIKSVLLEMDKSSDGQNLLKNLKVKGWGMAQNNDWDDVRSLNIEKLDTLIKSDVKNGK